MFNIDIRDKAVKDCQNAVAQYNNQVDQIRINSENLYNLRKTSRIDLFKPVEDFINKMKNTPVEFDKSFNELRTEYENYDKYVKEIEERVYASDFNASAGAGTGMLAGTGVAALGPSAAMAIATTFGTASTGTAISTLSGAVATKAALAWLGGGAIAAGGGGVAAGNALLALAGPIGWGIAGVSLLGAGYYYSNENEKIAKKATEEANRIRVKTSAMNLTVISITSIYSRTLTHKNGILNILQDLKNAPEDYRYYDNNQKSKLLALINNIQAFSKLLKETPAQ